MEHAFNVAVAKEHDVNIAIFLQNMKYWTFNNLANKRNIHDGYCWTYNTLDALCLIFPYWSLKQIRTIIEHCIEKQLIIKGNYNKTNYDRTCWYALTPKSYDFFPELMQDVFINDLNTSLPQQNSICPKGQMDLPIWANGSVQKGRPIPDTIPDTKTHTPIIPKGIGAFDEFWKLYPKKKAEDACRTKWKAKKLDLISDEIINKLKEQIEYDDEWLRGFIPNPSTYINQKRWKDEICKPRPDSPIIPPKKETPLAPIVVYSSFTAELKLMKKFKEIPDETPIPTFEQWTFQGITGDARTYVRGLK
jgi:hypothetical protein